MLIPCAFPAWTAVSRQSRCSMTALSRAFDFCGVNWSELRRNSRKHWKYALWILGSWSDWAKLYCRCRPQVLGRRRQWNSNLFWKSTSGLLEFRWEQSSDRLTFWVNEPVNAIHSDDVIPCLCNSWFAFTWVSFNFAALLWCAIDRRFHLHRSLRADLPDLACSHLQIWLTRDVLEHNFVAEFLSFDSRLLADWFILTIVTWFWLWNHRQKAQLVQNDGFIASLTRRGFFIAQFRRGSGQ